MAYTTINKSSLQQNQVLYDGDGTDARGITGVGFQPDLTIIKQRDDYNRDWIWTDAVRGATKTIRSNTNGAESTDTSYLQSFNSDGFTIGDSANVNNSSGNNYYVAFNWKANGAGSSNTDGSITSTVSANTTAGFSIVKWTNNTSSVQTVGHGLGVAPKMIIMKVLGNTGSWNTYHHSLGNTHALYLNSTAVSEDNDAQWNDTSPTSTVFTTGTNGNLVNNTLVAYCFAEKTGYSKFGSYSGNTSSDGTFIYTGFKPTFLIVKGTTTAESWCVFDNKRNTYNPNNKRLLANAHNTEATIDLDFLSNGIKFRTTDNAVDHANTYMYMAFGQTMVGTNNIPATAR